MQPPASRMAPTNKMTLVSMTTTKGNNRNQKKWRASLELENIIQSVAHFATARE